jgi:photosystem II stability/assembly factor-like uncharacterized protein
MVDTNAIAGSKIGLWYSSNSGQTWIQSNQTTDTFSSVYMVGTNAIAGGLDTGLWYSSNSGVTWVQSNKTNDSFNSVYMVDTNAIAGSSSNTGLWYSSNSGQTWVQSNNTTDPFSSVYMVGSNAIAGSSSTTGLWYSSNSGQTWVQSNKTDDDFFSVYMVGSNAVAGSGSNTGLWYSSDSGVTWTQSNSRTTGSFRSVYMVGTNAVAGSGTESGVWYSDDSGQTWTQYSNETYRTITSVAMNTSYNLIAGGDNFMGYDLTFPCFNKGTKLICLHNNEEVLVPIEDMEVGMLVKTYGSGYVPVKYIQTKELLNDINKPLNSMWKMKGTDFIVTGGHSILVDELTEEQMNKQLARGFENTMRDKKFLLACYSDDFDQIKEKELFQIYHLVLENGHYGVYSENNIITETCEEKYFEKFLL